MVLDATNVPFVTGGGNLQGPTITITDLDDCVITAVRVRFRVTATSLTASTTPNTVFRLDRLGGPIGFDLINLGATTLTPLVGTQMGTTCTSLTFADGFSPFSTSAAPYDGNFSPVGSPSSPGSFADYLLTPANGHYSLYPAFLGGPVTVECFQLDLDLETTPAP